MRTSRCAFLWPLSPSRPLVFANEASPGEPWGILTNVLLLDDDDELPASPDEGETALVAQLGAHALLAIDVTLKSHNQRRWLKVARVVAEALKAGGFAVWNDSHVHLHVRRVIGLVDSGSLEAKGNLLRPRWSEVRLSEAR